MRPWIAVLPMTLLCFPSLSNADLAGDAKNALEKLRAVGDCGRSAAESGAGALTRSMESSWTNLETTVLAKKTELAAVLAESRVRWNDRHVPVAFPPDFDGVARKIDAISTAVTTARTARDLYKNAVDTERNAVVNDTISTIRGRVDSAISTLKGLVPKPVGDRPATKTATCKEKLTGISVPCTVPNGPPSDDELRSAIDAANAALREVSRAGDSAGARIAGRVNGRLNALFDAMLIAVATVSNASLAVHENALAVIKNMR